MRAARSLARVALIAASCMPLPVGAQGANYGRKGFAFPADRKPRVLVMYPDWYVGTLSTKGESENNPEWSRAAVDNMRRAMAAEPALAAADLQFMTSEQAETSPVLGEVRKSFAARTSEVIFRVPQGTPPGQKAKSGYYDYTIGADLAGRIRAAHGDADYVLLMIMHDAYSTSGQKLGSFLAAGLSGALGGPIQGVPQHHYGNGMLIDLKDGSVVWFHGDGAYGGDPRTPDGAVKRMHEAMERFPGSVPARR